MIVHTMPPSSGAPPPPIAVDDVRVAREPGRAVLSARLRAEGLSLPVAVWIEVGLQFADGLTARGDPFLPPLLLRAMKEQRPLVLEVPVSPFLIAAVPRVMDIHAAWSRPDVPLRPVSLAAPSAPSAERGRAAATFFSTGVDSFFTLLRNLSRYPRSDSRAISHIIVVHGLDVSLDDTARFGRIEAAAQAVARALDLRVVTVRTNVREALRTIDWGRHAHGAALASVALALAPLFHTVFIASSSSFLELHPWGSHPMVDPLWSTEALEVVHDGADTRRGEKVRYVAQSPLALAHLRVCWEHRGADDNCGRCEKCLRTMVGLELAGALDRTPTFPARIAPAELRALAIRPDLADFYWRELVEQLRRSERHRALLAEVEGAIDRGRRAAAEGAAGLRAAAWRRLARLGLTA